MRHLVQPLLDWIVIAIVFGVQTGLVCALVLMVALLVVPEASLIKDVVKWVKGM